MAFSKQESPRKIPGFYFDKEKKRYFKIPPKTDKSANVNIPNKKRKSNKRIIPPLQVPKGPGKSSRSNLFRSHQYGVTSALDYHRKMERLRWEQAPTRVLSLPYSFQLYPDKVEALCLSRDGRYLIRKHVIASTYPNQSNFGIYSVLFEKGNNPVLKIDKIVHFASYHTQFSGCDWVDINGDQWALFAFQRDGPFNSNSSTLLAYQLKQPFNNPESIVENDVQIIKRPWVMEESPWNVAANSSPHKCCGHFGIGGETRQHMYDVELKMRYSYSTSKVTVLSQGFCKQSPYLVSGLRNGEALVWDLRSFPSDPAHVMHNENKQQRSPIIWLQPIMNDNFILAQKQNGELALWDTRTYKKCVVYNHSNSNICLDLIGHRAFLSESERLLMGFPRGDDSPMFYDVLSGDVLKNKIYKSQSFGIVHGNSRFCYGNNWGGGISRREGVFESTGTESWRFFHM